MNKITASTPLDKVPPIEAKISYSSSGYPYFYMPSHPLASKNGTVSLARHNASLKIGRWLKPDEVVRHQNNNRHDVAASNLMVISKAEAMQANAPYFGNRVTKICEWCGEEFSVSESHADRRSHCSPKCAQMARRKFHAMPEELRLWVWETPLTQLGKALGVSDNAVRKRCRKYGIPTPPRGYWTLIKAGWSHIEALESLNI
ncbi:MAG: hypothetical protein U9O54_04190 [Chloroflexota bacterium]|nr:hypothetical protein [Chloroflexota bacterium]